ncbi:MAG: methylated-DNA--[protein]-cysteine S-methyltransferase [Myxococcales bacterium]|nr:methylated-DNA--[protein]-cysteine S-methyltransferase [Myxococcales bacterium]
MSSSRAAPEIWTVDRLGTALPLLISLDEEDAIVHISLGGRLAPLERFASRHRARLRVETRKTAARRQLVEYFAGRRRRFDLRVRLLGTPFQREAWRALVEIPYGETRSYAQQAERLGNIAASRAVGRANALNPVPIVVPCHRVIGHDGGLTGFGGGLPAKRWLLDLEDPQRSLFVTSPRIRAAGRVEAVAAG